MARISDTTEYPVTPPALDDRVTGTDKSDTTNHADGETVQFEVQDLLAANTEVGAAAPASAPAYVGRLFVDQTNGAAYIAFDTAAAADFKQVLTTESGDPITTKATPVGTDKAIALDSENGNAPVEMTLTSIMALAPVQSVAGQTGSPDAATLRTALNVEDGAAADQTGAEMVTAIDAELGGSSWQTGEANTVDSDPSGVTGADQITNIMSLTQAEYDAIVTKNAATLYVISG